MLVKLLIIIVLAHKAAICEQFNWSIWLVTIFNLQNVRLAHLISLNCLSILKYIHKHNIETRNWASN